MTLGQTDQTISAMSRRFANGSDRRLRLCAITVLALALQACASVAPRNAVPEELVDEAVIPGGAIARLWGDAKPPDEAERVSLMLAQQRAREDEDASKRAHSYLLISGGGNKMPSFYFGN